MNKKDISKYFSKLGKRSHELKPRSKEYYKNIRAIGVAKMKAKELSTD